MRQIAFCDSLNYMRSLTKLSTLLATLVVAVFSVLIYRGWAQSTATTIGSNITTTGSISTTGNILSVGSANPSSSGLGFLRRLHLLGPSSENGRTGIVIENGVNGKRWEFGAYEGPELAIMDRGTSASPLANTFFRVFGINPLNTFVLVDGNVGIGTVSPTYDLDVVGTIRTGSTSPLVIFEDSDGTANKKRLDFGYFTSQLEIRARNDAEAFVRNILTLQHDGNVGIGTTSPATRLQINNADDTSVEPLRIYNDNGNLAFTFDVNSAGQGLLGVYSDGTQTQQFYSGGDSYINTGNLGIGTTGPGSELDVRGSYTTPGAGGFSADGVARIYSTNVAGAGVGGVLALGGETALSTTPYPFAFIQGAQQTVGEYGGVLSFWTTSSGGGGETNSANYERMRITKNGNTGIGTTSPGAKLQVTGGDAAITTQGNGMILKATDGASCYRVTVNNAGTLATASVTCP